MSHYVGKNHFAYVFYTTNDKYAVAVLIIVKLLKQFSVKDDIDFVVLHLPEAKYILTTMRFI